MSPLRAYRVSGCTTDSFARSVLPRCISSRGWNRDAWSSSEPQGVTSTTSTSCSATPTRTRWSPSRPRRSRTSTVGAIPRSSLGHATRPASRSTPRTSSRRSFARDGIDEVVFSYSDVSHEHVMHVASRALAAGADFRLVAPAITELDSSKPCVAVCAVRTGAGKSQTGRRVAQILRDAGNRVAVLRHPMPYGDLSKQVAQRFARYEDLDAADCTIEEREEYEPHLDEGNLVFAGVDYARILALAEAGGGRDRLGGRQQRHAVHPTRSSPRDRRPAPTRPRAALPPGRDEPSACGRLHRQQGRHGRAGGRRRRSSTRSSGTTRTRRS